MRLKSVVFALATICASMACDDADLAGSAASIFRLRESALFEAHAAILQQEGRLPADFEGVHYILGRYGWHGHAGHERSDGVRLRRSGGAFGAYSFYQPAFEQAQRSWWIHGVMEAGSDILRPVNMNAKFADQVVGYRVGHISVVGSRESIRDAVVVEVPKYFDGSSTNTLRLDTKASGFALGYNIGILPPDFVSLCECGIPNLIVE